MRNFFYFIYLYGGYLMVIFSFYLLVDLYDYNIKIKIIVV